MMLPLKSQQFAFQFPILKTIFNYQAYFFTIVLSYADISAGYYLVFSLVSFHTNFANLYNIYYNVLAHL